MRFAASRANPAPLGPLFLTEYQIRVSAFAQVKSRFAWPMIASPFLALWRMRANPGDRP